MISISWGAPEIYYSSTLLTNINNRFATAVARGINICAATGDNGSNNGVGGSGSYTDFPASSPNVVACGGTKLVCPNLVYDSSTTEVAWTYGGGAISAYFSKPTYQNALPAVKRSIPDIAMNADPNSGVAYLVNGSYYIYGGTSVAAPTVAAYLMALNTTRPAHNVFYTNVNAFNDVVSGTNGAFNASLGYDNCTGLGSINGAVLTTAFNNQISQPLPQPSQPSPPPVVVVSSVRLSSSSLRIKFNKTYQLNATILPSNAINKSLTWTSSNTRIVTVSSTGLIRTINYGTATIRVTSVSNPNRFATVSITVIR
jgi:kumamolisin